MSNNPSLKDFEPLIRECVKCGACQAHCPAYSATKKEGAVARGKVTLAAALLDGKTECEERLQEDISLCLMCGSCYDKCPNKVPTHEIVGAVRRQISEEKGLTKLAKGVSAILGSRTLLKTLTKAGALFSPLMFKKVPESSGLRLRLLRLPGMEKRTLPPVARTSLLSRIPEFIQGEKDKATIGFFAGCAITYLYPEIGEKMVQILKGMGFSVFTPNKQGCCGIPALSAGNGQLVQQLADKNLQAFEQRPLDYIVTACASCNGGIGEHYRIMKSDYAPLTAKVIDFSVFLSEHNLFKELAGMPKWSRRKKVSYHDPCHLRIQGITREPRELLRALPNVDFVEMDNAATCCGLGGTFSIHHYEKSKKIGAAKIQGLLDNGAEFIATGCPGCIMQLQDSINHAGLPVQALHLLDLLSEAYTKSEQSA